MLEVCKKSGKYKLIINPLIFIAIALFLTLVPYARAGELNISHNIPFSQIKPVIDGEINPEEWEVASHVSLDNETFPSQNVPALVDTEVLMMEDGANFYLAFIASDSEPDKIRAFYRDRDSSWGDDFVGIIIDTFNDERRSFEFFANALGVQSDAIYDDVVQNEDTSWNAIWDSAGKINDKGYVVEMKIPLSQLRFPAGVDRQTWGIDILRFYPRDKRHRFSNNRKDYNLSCYLCQFKKAQGFTKLEQKLNLQVVPTITASYSRDRIIPGDSEWDSEYDPEVGMDIRWGINQDFYLNATINPDFSQVEADVAQLNVNNTFLLFFPERREFFLDGADYFNTHENLVYTRNISSPEYGLKLTGKRDDHAYGLFIADDESTNLIIPDSQGSVIASLENVKGMNTAYRYRLDINQNTNLGLIFTDRRADDYSNTVTGIDGNIRLGNSDQIKMLFMKSFSEYPDQIQHDYNQKPKMDDYAYLFHYEHNDNDWHWESKYTEYGDDFRADMGFINRVDYKQLYIDGGHIWHFGPGNRFSRIYFGGNLGKINDESGNDLEEERGISINADGPMQSFIMMEYLQKEHFYNGLCFDEYSINFYTQMRPMAGMESGLDFSYGDKIDYDNTRLGRVLSLGPRISMQIGKHFQAALRHNYQKMDIDGKRLYTTNLSDLRFTYQFGIRSFLRAIIQYSNTRRDPYLYTFDIDIRSKNLTTQLLYSYKINPQTRFFIGYSDTGFQDDDMGSIKKTNFTVFTKLSYAWQY
jgi:hypothetical protein